MRRQRKWSREVVHMLSSLTLEEIQAQGLLKLRRGYWVVESRLPHCLDITMGEDRSRVRHPKAARVLGTLRRVVMSFANEAVNRARKRNPKTKCGTVAYQKTFRSARGGKERLHVLVFSKYPKIPNLED